MVAQEQRGCIVTEENPPSLDKVLLDLAASTVDDFQLKEQCTAGDDFAPKARKPYTITKQRERWTEEEHKKFLEALKLYGRAWRRIEEHVGTKTAVQIRSHAQKFFSKVVRESNTSDGALVKPIEIPPPRPKRKPMHPYPRKLASPVKAGILIPEKPAGSASMSMMGQENQSPTSVLSAVGSDLSAGADSCVPNGSPSSVSSELGLKNGEMPKLMREDAISYREDENSSTDEEIPLDLDLTSRNESATLSLKLFGKTLLVEPQEQSCATRGTCNPKSNNRSDDTGLIPLRVVPLKLYSEDLVSAFSDGLAMPVYSSIKTDVAPFLWLTLASDSSPEVLSPTPIKAQSLYAKKQMMDEDEHKDGSSSTGSNTDIVGDSDTCLLSLERKGKEAKSFSSYKLVSKRISSKCRSGFVPYKRCFAEQASSTEIAEDREKQRIRLCL